MPKINRYEQQFLDALKDIFIGAKVEGDSGYINLMRIKSRYYTEGVFPQLMKDIDAACKPFESAFREELFDKLYDFFKRYFSESGSIYFCHTPQHANIYEKVYTDERDVMLFWKTHMLYYVKTDRLFKSLDVDIDGTLFYFDASEMEHKRSNEKRELIYTLKDYKSGKVVLGVTYSEKGRKTKTEDILRGLKARAVVVDEDTLLKACLIFEKQSEVDYFINKNAQAFLKEQFDLWMYQYIFIGQSDFEEKRLKQLQAIKRIANNIIDFIAQFEDELVRIWNKPKFVLNSHYVITLDKITKPRLRKKIFAHPGMKAQVQEWQELGMVGKDFKISVLAEQHELLALDTRYFPDLELDILALFDDLDAALDGWLIHSENYQALNTFVPKFRQKVQAIYIDPPYNANATEIIYENRFKHSTWATLMQDRLFLAKEFLKSEGMICVTIDDYEMNRLQLLMDNAFGDENYLATIAIRNNPSGRSTVKGFAINHEYGLFYAKSNAQTKVGRFPHTEKQKARYDQIDENSGLNYEWENLRKSSSGSMRVDRPKQFFPIYYSENENALRIPKMNWSQKSRSWNILEQPTKDEVIIYPLDEDKQERVWSYGVERINAEIDEITVYDKDGKYELYKRKYLNERGILARTWWDKRAYSARDNGTRTLVNLFGVKSKEFEFPKALQAVQDSLLVLGANDNTTSIDFFAGSGTTAHAVMNSNHDGGKRKYIMVEMGDHFSKLIIPRVKKVAFSNKWKRGVALQGKGISHFAKYYELEQYEDALSHANYQDSGMFAAADAYNSYVFMRDLKMLDTISLDKAQNKVNVHLEKLYPGIDLAETLSCITGKGIKRITKETVEFQDGTSSSLTNPDWELIKPLVWW